MEAISFPYNSAAYMPVVYFEILQYTYKVSLQACVCVLTHGANDKCTL